MLTFRDFAGEYELTVPVRITYMCKIKISLPTNVYLILAVVPILLYRCTTWTLIKTSEQNLDDNCTRILRAILNTFCKQHSTKKQLYLKKTAILKTIRTRQMGHCWMSKDELKSIFLQLAPSYERASVG